MAKKKFRIRNFNPGTPEHKHLNPLIDLSRLGLDNGDRMLKLSLAHSTSETQMDAMQDQSYPDYNQAFGADYFVKFKDLTKNQTNNYAYYDMSYQQRRQACQQMARDSEINFILQTITNEAIVQDDNGYIAHLDLDRLKMFLNKAYTNDTTGEGTDKIIRDCKIAYNTIYSCLGWDDNNGGWEYFRKFLIEGFLAFEILVDARAKTIIGFKEIDPITLQPCVEELEDGTKLFVWYQFKGDASMERKIPDSNLIYISWNSKMSSRVTNISYVESLTRAYNMLKSLENSQLIWNIQNAQKRMKITIPVGNLPPARAQNRIQEVVADYDEEVSIDEASGQMLVNGEPKFNFQKTYVFEDRNGSAVNMEAVDTGGYELGTEALQYFWRKFILESQVPANRFMMNVSSAPSNQFIGDANVTREEYAFGRFIQRIRGMFREVLLKPLWVQICLKYPNFAKTEYLKSGLGIKYNEENLFSLAKKRSVVSEGATTVSTLLGITGSDEKPYFSLDFLIKEYIGLTDQQLDINRKYKEAEIIRSIETAKLQKKHADDQLAATPDAGGASAEGGGGFGGDMGGGGFGGPPPSGGFGDDAGGPDDGGGF